LLILKGYLKFYSLNSFRFSTIYWFNTYCFNLAKFKNVCLNVLVGCSNGLIKFLISLNELFVYPNDSYIINIDSFNLNSYVDLNISYIKYNNLYFAKSTNTFIKLSQNPFINVSKMPNMTRFKVYGWFKSGFNRFRGKFWF